MRRKHVLNEQPRRFRLYVSGDWSRRGICVWFDGQLRELTPKTFQLLMDLVRARGKEGSNGFIRRRAKSVHDLRQKINGENDDEDQGFEFVETGLSFGDCALGEGLYRLGFDPYGEFGMGPAVRELVEVGLLGRMEYDELELIAGVITK